MNELKFKYKNMTNGTKIVTALLKTITLNVPFQNEDLKLLISNHPDDEKDANNIEYFVVKLNIYKDRELRIKTLKRPEDSVSYKTCLRVLFGNKKDSQEETHRKNILLALRNEISDTKRLDFLNDSGDISTCFICNMQGKMEIDHFGKCFQQIVDEFISTNDLKYDNMNYIYSGKEFGNNWYVTLQDKEIKQKWVKYHDENANFRFLCMRCNGSVGSSGYKRQT